MTQYYRLMLGRGSKYAVQAISQGFIGVDFGIHQDFSGKFTNDWRKFNKMYIPLYLKKNPQKSKVAAGLAGGAIWTLGEEMQIGDIVLCHDGQGKYFIGEISGKYYFQSDDILPHRRPVKWLEKTIPRVDMSESLRKAVSASGTLIRLNEYKTEIENLISDHKKLPIISTDEEISDPLAFAMEKHLEDFLVSNWANTPLGKDFDMFEEDGEIIGQQYPTDTGPIDILAISKDRKKLLVVELKKGRASDVVVGQILRYMGYVKEELSEPGQDVEGVIIALEDDERLHRALSMVSNVKFYRYKIKFELIEG